MKLLAAAAIVLSSLPCFADEVLHLKAPAHLSLARGALAAPEDADLEVSAGALSALNGVRREDGGDAFTSSVGLSPGAVYLVKDDRLALRRVRVSVVSAGTLRVELLDGRPTLGLALPARYRCVAVALNGQPSDATYGELLLSADGTYRVGQVRGAWRIVDDALQLDGPMAHWGPARSPDAGQTLGVSFRRGPVTWALQFQRVDEGTVAAR